ncbi:hypothetical protein GIB67_009652 [Kingdonia uniflora]|uniref:Uncharacterized protein n=1 Tax=Kingdonia uniflora TaxID=39325 RepID=A0A7J7LAZ5_9MAGN|nr:hypothetical protein GIB67_009652 [Kingdonia uniflora]
MSVTCSYPHIRTQNESTKQTLLPKVSKLPTTKPSAILMRSSREHKVFEDQSRGIVCYKNAAGEMVCEGYDEGPRYHNAPLKSSSNQRNLHLVEILSRSRIQTVEGYGGFNYTQMGVAPLEGFDWNGFIRHF